MKTFAEAKKELERRYTDEKMSENYLEAIEAYGFAKALGYIYGEDESMLPVYSKILENIIPNVIAHMAIATAKNMQNDFGDTVEEIFKNASSEQEKVYSDTDSLKAKTASEDTFFMDM